MATVTPTLRGSREGTASQLIASGRVAPSFMYCVAQQRATGDPLFEAAVRLDNLVVGSRYMLLDQSTGQVLASGTAASSTVTLASVPAYSSSMLIECRVRHSGGSLRYIPFTGYAYHAKLGISIWIAQVEDPIV